MGEYDFLNKKGGREVTKNLEERQFPMDRPWKYYPFFVISSIKGTNKPRPNDHERRPF